jgi:hypothetical protein
LSGIVREISPAGPAGREFRAVKNGENSAVEKSFEAGLDAWRVELVAFAGFLDFAALLLLVLFLGVATGSLLADLLEGVAAEEAELGALERVEEII